MASLIKKAFIFLLHPTALRTNILVFLIVLALIPITVMSAGRPQTIQQEAAVKIPPPQPQSSTLFYIEPFIIDGIKKTNTQNIKDKNITLYLYNLTDDPIQDSKETKVFRKLTIPAAYDKTSNTFSSSKFSFDNTPVGKYQLLLKVSGSLKQNLGTEDLSSSSETIIIQGKEIKLIMGDINNDNEINMLDYAMIANCFEAKAVTSLCQNIDQADLNYDGLINSLDYDFFLESLVSKTKKL